MNEELRELLEELFAYFELDSPEWPLMSVYSGGTFYQGIISDELYEILTNLREIVDEEQYGE